MKKEKIQELVAFLSNIEKTAEKCFDQEEKFDCTITLNGKSIILPFSADLCDALNRILDEEIDYLRGNEK